MNTLQIKDLDVSIEGKQIIRNLNLTINSGEVHALIGPNMPFLDIQNIR